MLNDEVRKASRGTAMKDSLMKRFPVGSYAAPRAIISVCILNSYAPQSCRPAPSSTTHVTSIMHIEFLIAPLVQILITCICDARTYLCVPSHVE